MDWSSIISAGSGAVGDMVGHKNADPLYDQGLTVQGDAYRQVLELLAAGKLVYDPQTATFTPVGPSAMAGAKADPQSIQAQQDALGKLQQASKEGYGDIDKAAINGLMNDVNQNERSQRDAQLARLDPGSGASIAARMGAQQSAANNARQQSMDIAAASRKQALAALAGYGNLASGMRGQSFNEAAQRAQAQDAIDKFNAQNAYGASQFNANAANQAAQNGINNRLGASHEIAGAAGNYSGALNGAADRKYNSSMRTATTWGNLAAAGAAGAQNVGNGNQPSNGPTTTHSDEGPYSNGTTTITNSDGSSTSGGVTDYIPPDEENP